MKPPRATSRLSPESAKAPLSPATFLASPCSDTTLFLKRYVLSKSRISLIQIPDLLSYGTSTERPLYSTQHVPELIHLSPNLTMCNLDIYSYFNSIPMQVP